MVKKFNGSTFQKLKERINDELGIDLGEYAERTYRGHWQETMGTFSWYSENGIGSQDTMTELINCDKISMMKNHDDIELFAENNNIGNKNNSEFEQFNFTYKNVDISKDDYFCNSRISNDCLKTSKNVYVLNNYRYCFLCFIEFFK